LMALSGLTWPLLAAASRLIAWGAVQVANTWALWFRQDRSKRGEEGVT
jgi:hypothetical protein